ncbi:MAG TPA: sulfide/dihydroorotate dehydrogenase-like FAD/NAD-binding protein [Syntrophomonadaceae bacterium]|nr:sulfide/dihydroorotate dehydrogenase-like FAD/NAD-binding protein [Syntrophomonadaceae bacterium]HNX28347.1 sulfide/dihydroorotate dehydrogenase-like FAD/NAD-binding protein [Syntrophomonadaceae bacterium]HPR92721.1 sulfide/dihydroorotate dehydrogenase-like FAD/NAD-binding protein [Syntrophomonadaceae bacterium]
MVEIMRKETLAEGIKLFEVSAPEIAAKARPGQFIILRTDEQGERIPLTIADFDREQGTLTLIFQEVGRSTTDMGRMEAGDRILDMVGPLGRASEIEKYGRVVCIGGGVGIAPVYPITRALKAIGNEVISIIGARTAEQLILKDEMKAVSDQIYITSDDGTIGEKGFVTEVLQKLLAEGAKVDLIVAIGPLPMMKAVSETSKPYGVKTTVSMNPIMVDGTGMCGACRVAVGNETKFACVDGPEFDGHQVDWNLARNRSRMFLGEERVAREHSCSGGECQCQKKKSE